MEREFIWNVSNDICRDVSQTETKAESERIIEGLGEEPFERSNCLSRWTGTVS